MDNFRGLLRIRKMDKVPHIHKAVVRGDGETKGLDEKIDENVLRWFAMWRGWRTIGLLRGPM